MPDWHALVREHFQGRRALSDQAAEELAQHVEETWRAAKVAGRSDTEAMAAARAELEHVPPDLPSAMTAPMAPGGLLAIPRIALRDVVYAARQLRARPGFAAVAALTLALGVGANTAIFSIVRSLLLAPLPFPQPDRLVMLWEGDTQDPSRTSIVSAPNYRDLSLSAHAFQQTGIWEFLSYNVSGDGGEAERVSGIRVSAATFTMLRVEPELGRTFSADEDAPGHDVTIISDGLWRRRFAGRPDIIGQPIRVNGTPFQIVGVMPASFRFPQNQTALWMPIAFNAQDANRGSHSFYAAARLTDGVPLAAAKAEVDAIGRTLAKQYPDSNDGETATVTPMNELFIGQLKPMLFALSGAVMLVLAIACVNVANLLLAQASVRRQEFAIRAALGASGARLAAQLVCESLVLSLAGGAAGLAVAYVGTRLLAGALPVNILNAPFRDTNAAIQLDPSVLAFTAIVALGTGLLFSLAPIAGLRRGRVSDLKAAGGRGATGRQTALRTILVGTEVALALIVLVSAGLMVKSLTRLVKIDPGLNPHNVLIVGMTLPQSDFYGPPVRTTFCSKVTERVGGLPGVLKVGAISHLPLSGANAGREITIEGRPAAPGASPGASYRVSCPGYFPALGIPMIRGRDFTTQDTVTGQQVVIINEETATRYWPKEDPIGRRIKVGGAGSSNPWMTIVGVAGNVRHFGLDEAVRREMFRPYSQAAWPVMTVVAKTAGDPGTFAPVVRASLEQIDPDLPVSRVSTMETVEQESMGSRWFPMILLGAFGAIALALALVGVYGVVSYIVSQRTREIGIRIALGAQRGQVLRLVLAGAMRPVLAGLVVGAVGAMFAARLLGTLLYAVKPGDPAVLAGIVSLLAAAAVVASLVPGARATRVDPVSVLKVE